MLVTWAFVLRAVPEVVYLLLSISSSRAADPHDMTAQCQLLSSATTSAARRADLATHVLIGNTAIPLGVVDLPEQLGRIKKQDERFYLDSGKQEFLLNRQKVAGKHEINLGDSIQAGEDSEAIRLIQVRNG